MKKLLLLFAIFSVTIFYSQNSEPYSFSEVVKVNDSTKSAKELYSNAKIWFANTFKDPKEVIVLDDTTNNILIGRGNMRYSSQIFSGSAGRAGWITFDTQIACKNGRYKYTFSNFVHEGHSINLGLVTNDPFLPTMKGFVSGGPENYKIKVTNEIRDKIRVKTEALISSLKETMSKNIATKEDW